MTLSDKSGNLDVNTGKKTQKTTKKDQIKALELC